MKITKLLAAFFLLTLASIPAVAQNATMTPYSRYGYGMLNDNASSAQRAMGSVGYAMNSGRQINVMNPASYAGVDSLTFIFDLGADLSMVWQEDQGNRSHQFAGGLDYITMAFRLYRHLGASLGVLPYSSVGYAFGSNINNGSAERSGSGSINFAYAGIGWEPFKRFMIGMNFGYLFGSTTNATYATTDLGSRTTFQREMEVRDWNMDLGVQYAINLNSRSRITLGARFSPGKDLHGNTFGIYYDQNRYVDNKLQIDTIGYTKLKGQYTLPATIGAGINYQWGGRLMAELDFTYQPWKDAKYAKIETFEQTAFDNRWRAGLGVEYIPHPRGSYFRRVQYRLGGYFNHDYLNINGNNIREYGLTMGFGLPVPGFKTLINLGFEYRHRQASPVALIKEDYFNITLGVNFNEMWFRKSKIY